MKDSELERLIAEWLSEQISPEDFQILNRRLREDPEARSALRHAANIDSGLLEWASKDAPSSHWLPAPSPTLVSAAPIWIARWHWPLGLAAAALFAFATYQVGVQTNPVSSAPEDSAEQTSRGVAILTTAAEPQWSTGSGKIRPGDSLGIGPLSLESGLAQIEFFSGATLVIEGPANFEILSAWEVAWNRGKVRVRVPPAARGFELLTPQSRLVDLGTEFGVDLSDPLRGALVQVFSGEVDAHIGSGEIINLLEGQVWDEQTSPLTPSALPDDLSFPTSDRLHAISQSQADLQFSDWRAHVKALQEDPRLLAHYDFQRDPSAERLIRNVNLTSGSNLHDGGAVGARWTQGRWSQKDALEFKRPGDRVRLQLEGTYNALTFAGWVKVDGLDRTYNSLFLTDGYEVGEPHWQIFEDGRLMFSLTYLDLKNSDRPRNRIYYSPVIFDHSNTGRWHHLAVTYENQTGAVVQYVDGIEVSREIDEQHTSERTIIYGACELGNWGLTTIREKAHRFPIRNLNGSIDEFAIFSTALSAPEIRAMHDAGSPE